MTKRRFRQVFLSDATEIAGLNSDSLAGKLFVDTDNDYLYYIAEDGTPTIIGTSGGGGASNLSIGTKAATTLDIDNDNGTGVTLPAATTTVAGLQTAADKTKLDGIATGATANSSDAFLLSRTNHTGSQTASTISDFDTEVSNNTSVSTNTTHRGLTNNPHSTSIANIGSGTLAQLNSALTDYEVGAYSLCKARGDNASDNYANTEVDIPWQTPLFNTASDVSISGANITCNTAGLYKFTVMVRTDNNNRTELIIRTYQGGVVLANEISSDYVSRDTDQNTGSMTHVCVLNVSASTVIKFSAEGDSDGTCTGLSAGTILVAEYLGNLV